MGVKADKTFEEIVERIVALFGPQSAAASPIDNHTGDSRSPASDAAQNSPASSNSPIPDDSQEDSGPA